MPDVSLPLLSRIQIASPCPAKWDEMTGDEITRHCAQCDLDVHNLSAMTTADAEAFLQARIGGGRICARIFRRTDGTILTQDCPVGIALWRKRARFAAGRVAAALLFLATGGFVASERQREALSGRLRAAEPFRSVCAWFNPKATTPPLPTFPRGQFLAGDICLPPPPPPGNAFRPNRVPYVSNPSNPTR